MIPRSRAGLSSQPHRSALCLDGCSLLIRRRAVRCFRVTAARSLRQLDAGSGCGREAFHDVCHSDGQEGKSLRNKSWGLHERGYFFRAKEFFCDANRRQQDFMQSLVSMCCDVALGPRKAARRSSGNIIPFDADCQASLQKEPNRTKS